MNVLEIKNLTKNFGGIMAVSNISLEIKEGSLTGLIGPNGAGKTTLFNLITGVYSPTTGTIELKIGDEIKSIGGKKPFEVTSAGVGRTFQNIRLFKELTVIDNIKIGMHKRVKYSILDGILRTKRYYEEEDKIQQESEKLLDTVGLLEKKDIFSSNLPYGEQRRLEIARALATNPKVLFLDEPAAGMNPNETKDLTNLIEQIKNTFGITIILIEHDMSLVMKICEEIFVLEYGKLIACGNPEQIRTNKKVRKAYLGEG